MDLFTWLFIRGMRKDNISSTQYECQKETKIFFTLACFNPLFLNSFVGEPSPGPQSNAFKGLPMIETGKWRIEGRMQISI